MRAAAGSDADYLQSVLDLFREQEFYYTLTPPGLARNSVDDFLFNTRQGFCGHFASAFTTMARAAGIPARVVAGYQGGDWNPIGGYLIVRQSHAHAWSEVWLPERGWTRVDPTAAVAPERVERGFEASFAESEALAGAPASRVGTLLAGRHALGQLERRMERLGRAVRPRRTGERPVGSRLRRPGLARVRDGARRRSRDRGRHPRAVARHRTAPARHGPRCGGVPALPEHGSRGAASSGRPPRRRATSRSACAGCGRTSALPALAITETYLRLRYGPAPAASDLRLLRALVTRFRP